MTCIRKVGFLAGAAALTLTSGGYANTGSGDLQDRLAAAEAKIAELEAQQSDSWLTEQRTEEIRGLVQDVLADADTRSSLLGSGLVGGYDNGAVLGSDDGNWLLRTNIIMQQRFIYNSQDEFAGTDTNRSGFENTRTVFQLSGNVVNPDWFYLIRINVGNNDGGAHSANNRIGNQEAYLGYDYGNGWKVMVGRTKAPFLREELVRAEHQLAVERSIMNYLFTGGYTTGLLVNYETDDFHFKGAYTNGANTGATTALTMDTEYALTFRGEYKISGNWDQFDDFTSPMDSEQAMMVGAAVHFEKAEFGTAAGPEAETTMFTVDFSAEFDGANIFAAFVLLDVDETGSAALDDTSPTGFLVQGGYYLNEDWELFARWEFTDYDSAAAQEDLSVFTVGVNRYFGAGHNAKWTTDLGIGVNEVLAPSAPFTTVGADSVPGITGFRTDSATQDGQIVLRTQWQIIF